jgi:sulfatase maturation enzyme AslB (radical SAM superfamily)
MVTKYEIWRVQTFYNSNNYYTKYNKIHELSKWYFKSDNHNTIESAKCEANRYIKFIKKYIDYELRADFDEIYIINIDTTIEQAHIYEKYYCDLSLLRNFQKRTYSKNIFKYVFDLLQYFCCISISY